MGTAEVLAEIQKSKKKSSGKKLTYTGGGTAALLQSIRGGKSETFDSGWTSALAAPTTYTDPFLEEWEKLYKKAVQPKSQPDWISAVAAPTTWTPPSLIEQIEQEEFKRAMQRLVPQLMAVEPRKAIIVPQEPSSLEVLAFGLTGMMPAAGAAIARIGGKLASRGGAVGKVGKAIAGIGKAGKAAETMPGVAGFGARTAMRAGSGATEMAAFQQVADLPLLVNDPQMFLQTRPEHTAHAALMGAGFKTVLGAAGEAISLPARRAAAREALIQQAGQAIQPMMRDYQPLPIPEKPGMVIEQIGSRRTRPMPAKSEPVVGSRYTVPGVGEVTVSAVTPKTVRVKTAEGKTRVYTHDKWQGQAVVEPAPVTEPIKPAVESTGYEVVESTHTPKQVIEFTRKQGRSQGEYNSSISVLDDGSYVVTVFEGRDLSTGPTHGAEINPHKIRFKSIEDVRRFERELSDAYNEHRYNQMRDYARRNGIPTEQVEADIAKMRDAYYAEIDKEISVMDTPQASTKPAPETVPVTQPEAKPVETPKAKEPWEMSAGEFVGKQRALDETHANRPEMVIAYKAKQMYKEAFSQRPPEEIMVTVTLDKPMTLEEWRKSGLSGEPVIDKPQANLELAYESTLVSRLRQYGIKKNEALAIIHAHEPVKQVVRGTGRKSWTDNLYNKYEIDAYAHKTLITQALREGKRVPDAVVEEFIASGGKLPEKGLHPEIAAKYAPETRPTAPETVPVTQPEVKPVETPKASAPEAAKPATPTKASAPEPAKPATPEITTGQAEPSVTGARKSITEPERAARGKDPVEMQEYKTYSSAYKQGKKAVDSGKVDPRTLADEVAEKPRGLKPEETGALVYERQRMNNALKEAYAEADRAITAGDKAAYETAKGQIEALLDALDINDQALKRGGREASAALSAYKMVIKEDYSLTSLLQRKRVKEGRPLTEREQAKIVELHAQLEEATRALDKYRAESAEIIRMMNPESMEYGAANRIVTKQKAMEIEARLKAKLSQVGSSPDVTIVADLAELLIYHLEASARWTGSALRQYLKEKFPNLTDDIIDEAFKKAEADKRLTSAANRSAARTRTPKKMTEAKKLEMAKRRMEADLKRVTEAIEAIEQGKPLPKSSKKIVYDKEAKQLLAELQKARAKLKSLMPKKPLTDTQRLEATKKRLQDQIKQLNEAIAKGEPLKPKRAPVRLDAEASELRFKVHQLKTELDMIVNPAPKEPLASRIIAAHRTLMTMLDLSAALRQGAMLGVGERKAYFKAFKAMFRYAFSEKKFFELHEWINNHKYAPELYQSGLYIAPDSPRVRLKAREEAFQSRAFHGIRGFGKIVRGGERAYNGFLNYLRAQVFFKYVEAMPDAGLESMTRQAQFINEATGRGTLGGFERSAMALANVFFSPRFVTSRIQVWRHLFSKDPVVRKMAAKNLVGFTGAFLLTLKLAEWAGADVELDPRSSEFGNIRIGKIHIDLSAGMVPHVRYAAQIMTGTRKVGNHIEKINRADVAWRFVQSKFGPTAGFITSVLKGKNFVGEDYTLDNWRGVLFNELTPMAIQDIIEAAREEGWIMGAAIAPIAIFGGSVTTYQPETYEWMGNPKDKAGKEVKRLGLKLNKTSEYYMVDGEKVELTDEQAEKLHRRVGNAVRAAILAQMASQSYKQLSDKDKAKVLEKAADDARAKVRDKMRSELGLPPKAGSSSPSSINNYIRGQMRNAGP